MSLWNSDAERLLKEILQNLVRIPSVNPPGDESRVIQYLRERLEEAGVPCQVFEPAPGRANLVAVVEGRRRDMPVLLLSHIDVVPAVEEEWNFPPFSGDEVDGVIQGRGTVDTKQLTAMELVALLLLLKEEKTPERTVIFIASADEEGGSRYGMEYLTREQPQLFPPSYVLSEGGGFVVSQDGRDYRLCACGEKGNLTVTIWIPKCGRDNTPRTGEELLTALNEVLFRLSGYQSPTVLTPVMERFRRITGEAPYTDRTLKNLWEYGTRHGMHIRSFNLTGRDLAEGPAELVVDFKLLPGMTQKAVERLFAQLLAGLDVTWTAEGYDGGYLTDLDNDFARLLQRHSQQWDPGVEFLPMIALGSTDGRFIRSNVFGYTPFLRDLPFRTVLTMVHGKDERITLPSLFYGGRVLYETLRGYVLDG